MRHLKGILALGLFFAFAPLILFSVGAFLVLVWQFIFFLLPYLFTVLFFIFVFILPAILLFGIKFLIDLNREVKKKVKLYKYNNHLH